MHNYFKVTVFILFLFFHSTGIAQHYTWEQLPNLPSVLDVENGYFHAHAGSLDVKFLNATQTIARLSPARDTVFDFTPGKRLMDRKAAGMNQLGDISIQWRVAGEATWHSYRSAKERFGIKVWDSPDGDVIGSSELILPADLDRVLTIKRNWERNESGLVLRYSIENVSGKNIELGALGFPLIFNNILQGQSLDVAHHQNSFYDPYIGMDAGYLQVSRLDGNGPSLLVLPYGDTPFEAYRPLQEDPTPIGLDFEGFYEWMALSKSYAETDWKNAQQWNTPHSVVLQPGETKNWGLKFVLADSVKAIETRLIAEHRPVAVGVPGYVLPTDVDATLFLHTDKPVRKIEVFPVGALTWKIGAPIAEGWQKWYIKGTQYGRARLAITYSDGKVQTIHYKVILPESQTIQKYGHFLHTKQWFEQDDPYFHRSPGYITYDHERNKQVTQDRRAWIAGLSDEGGAGSWLGMAMKQMVLPDKTEVARLERFVDTTLWGQIQYKEGKNKFGVRKSLFFYAPDSLPKGTYDSSINFKTWSAWPIKEAMDPGRSYNYPHVAAAYWSLYRLSRNHKNLVDAHPWRWYLLQSYETFMNMMIQAPYYAQFGQMEGSVFYFILKDLKAEGLIKEASAMEAEMKKRALHWDQLPFPFESEMPWDSTGQEEVFIWSLYFGFDDKADVTYKAILAYMPTIPHWGYNGNARRYWDFLYGGKLQRIERMIHHYGSELNAIPLLAYFRQHPDDLYTLRVAYGGVLGGIANIDKDGFAPAAFHSYPSTLKNDGITGDYGSGFFGYAVNTASYLVHDRVFGWLAFGGNLKEVKNEVSFYPTTAAANHFFVAPALLDVSFLAGQIDHFNWNKKDKTIAVWLKKKDAFTPNAILEWTGAYKLSGTYENRNDGKYIIPLSSKKSIKIELKRK